MLHTKEYYSVMEQFEKDNADYPLHREAKKFWERGIIYQNGEVNGLFNSYLQGYSLGKSIFNN
jgi:hypothetical protein